MFTTKMANTPFLTNNFFKCVYLHKWILVGWGPIACRCSDGSKWACGKFFWRRDAHVEPSPTLNSTTCDQNFSHSFCSLSPLHRNIIIIHIFLYFVDPSHFTTTIADPIHQVTSQSGNVAGITLSVFHFHKNTSKFNQSSN